MAQRKPLMKKTLKCLIILLMTCYSSWLSAQNNPVLVLWHTDGSTTDVELYLQPKVPFSDGKILITSSVLDMEYPASEIVRFTYKGGETSIDAPQDVASFSKEGERIVFHGVKDPKLVSVFTSTGMSVPARVTTAGDGVALILSSIPRGVFVLSVNGKNYKISHS